MLVASHPISEKNNHHRPPKRHWKLLLVVVLLRGEHPFLPIPNDLPAMAGIKTIHDVRVYHAGVYNSIFVKKRVKKS